MLTGRVRINTQSAQLTKVAPFIGVIGPRQVAFHGHIPPQLPSVDSGLSRHRAMLPPSRVWSQKFLSGRTCISLGPAGARPCVVDGRLYRRWCHPQACLLYLGARICHSYAPPIHTAPKPPPLSSPFCPATRSSHWRLVCAASSLQLTFATLLTASAYRPTSSVHRSRRGDAASPSPHHPTSTHYGVRHRCGGVAEADGRAGGHVDGRRWAPGWRFCAAAPHRRARRGAAGDAVDEVGRAAGGGGTCDPRGGV